MKTICIYHSVDLDGWMSSAIVKKWFIKKFKNGKIYKSPSLDHTTVVKNSKETSLTMHGFNYGDEIPNLNKHYDKVIMCDISFPKNEMLKLKKDFGKNFIWIDHHKSIINELGKDVKIEGIQNTKYAACELTWKYFFKKEKTPKSVELLGLYDSFRHKGMPNEKDVLYFQYESRAKMSNYEECYQLLEKETPTLINKMIENGKVIYKYLYTEAKQIYKKSFIVDIDGKKGKIKFLFVNAERFNPINFGIDYHKKGFDGFGCFWFEDEMWHFSLYNDNGKLDVSKIAKEFGGGGHAGASGFVTDTISDVFENIK